MNCKQGDMAIVVRSLTGLNYGLVVTCIRLATEAEQQRLIGPYTEEDYLPVWHIDRPITWTYGSGRTRNAKLIRDFNLMPINPLNDETVDEEHEVKA